MFNIDDKVKYIIGYTGYIREIIFDKITNKIVYYCIDIIDNDDFKGHDGGHFRYDPNNNAKDYEKVCIQRSVITNRPGHMWYVKPHEIVLINDYRTDKLI